MGSQPGLIDDEVARLLAQMGELQRRVLLGHLSVPSVRRGLQHLIEGKPVASGVPASHFVPLMQQVQNIEMWNAMFGWGFSPELIARRVLEARTFDWPGDSLQAIVLVPSLESVSATFVALAGIAGKTSELNPHPYETVSRAAEDASLIWLIEGATFTPHSLEWRLVDLGAHYQPRGMRRLGSRVPNVTDFVTGETAAHAEVLAAAAHFPAWVQAVYKGQAPNVVISGYRYQDRSYTTPLEVFLGVKYSKGDIYPVLSSVGSSVLWDGYSAAMAYPVALGGNI